jgi:hypothetical protein
MMNNHFLFKSKIKLGDDKTLEVAAKGAMEVHTKEGMVIIKKVLIMLKTVMMPVQTIYFYLITKLKMALNIFGI